jgi:hypothetical protein
MSFGRDNTPVVVVLAGAHSYSGSRSSFAALPFYACAIYLEQELSPFFSLVSS